MQKSSILLTAFVVMFAASSVWAATPNATSIKNLKAAFIGETNASAKYAAFAKKAREEGYANVALLFQAASEAEKIHANNHGAALEQLGDKAPPVEPKVDVKSTKENLEEAIKGESVRSIDDVPRVPARCQLGKCLHCATFFQLCV